MWWTPRFGGVTHPFRESLLNRADFQLLAAERLRDAEALLLAGRWSGAYYLAGYAIECALKACIAKLTNLHDFPDKERTQRSYSHRIDVLLVAAEMKAAWQTADAASPRFGVYWQRARKSLAHADSG